MIGSKKGPAVGARIEQLSQNDCQNLWGQTSLAQALDLLGCTTAVVTNDSGLMHAAAALDKPLVALYGSSNPGFTPPLSDKALILNQHLSSSPYFKRECPLVHLNCLTQLSPERVLTALDPILG